MITYPNITVAPKSSPTQIIVAPEDLLDKKLFPADLNKGGLIANRLFGCVTGRGFWLDKDYDWTIGMDETYSLVLVPTKKNE